MHRADYSAFAVRQDGPENIASPGWRLRLRFDGNSGVKPFAQAAQGKPPHAKSKMPYLRRQFGIRERMQQAAARALYRARAMLRGTAQDMAEGVTNGRAGAVGQFPITALSGLRHLSGCSMPLAEIER